MPASAVSSPTASTRTLIAESVDTVPATTRSPGPRGTGLDSPVIIDSSRSASPSTMRPSAGTRPPGRTSTRSPTCSSPVGTGATVPSSRTTSASSGSSAARAASAPWAWPMARISCQWPSSMMVTSRASSHQNSRSNHPSDVAIDAVHATVMAMAIRSIMPGRPIADLRHGPCQERPPAPGEHEGAEHRPDPCDAGQLVAEPLHHHLARHTMGIDRTRLSQNRRRNIAGSWPACLSWCRWAPSCSGPCPACASSWLDRLPGNARSHHN